MKKIFAFCNQKGGVGKTTSIINISTILAQHGVNVLVIDLDSQGNATSGLGIEKPEGIESTTYQLVADTIDPRKIVKKTEIENLNIIPSNFELSGAELELVSRNRREFVLKERLSQIIDDYDFVFIDCPPSLGIITINALTASSYIVIPLQCEYYALEGLGQLLRTYHLVHEKLNRELEIGGVILTMADFRTNLTEQVIEEVKSYFKEKVFNTVIPRSVKLSEAPSFGKPAVIYDPYGKGSVGYREITKEFMERFGKGKAKEVKPDIADCERTDQEIQNSESETIAKEAGSPEKNIESDRTEVVS
jgi:chromosome partitioning protein